MDKPLSKGRNTLQESLYYENINCKYNEKANATNSHLPNNLFHIRDFLFLYCLYKRTMLLNVAMPGSAATIKNKALNKTDNIILYLQHKDSTIQQ